MNQLVAPTGVFQHVEYRGVRHTNPWKPQAHPQPSTPHRDAVGEQAALLASIWDSQAITKATFCKSTNPLYCGDNLHLQHTAESSMLSPADGKGRNLLLYLKQSFPSLKGSLHLALAWAPRVLCPPTDPRHSSSMLSIPHTATFPGSAKEQGQCQRRRHFVQSMFISCDTEHSICKELRKKTAAVAPLITSPQTSTAIYNLDDVAGTKYDLDPHTSSPPHFYRPCVIWELQLFKLFLWVRLSPARLFIAHSPFATGRYRICCRQ